MCLLRVRLTARFPRALCSLGMTRGRDTHTRTSKTREWEYKKKLQIWQIKLRMFASFVKNIWFFEKSLIQNFLFLYKILYVLHKNNGYSHQNCVNRGLRQSGAQKGKNGKSRHILPIIYTIYYICRINILKYKENGGRLRSAKTRQNSQNRGGGKICIKIKFFKKVKKIVYISANCTYNVNIKKH